MGIRVARHEDQGNLAPLLEEGYGAALRAVHEAARAAGLPSTAVEEELLAADDFYFSTLDLMNCCFFAEKGGEIVGTACVNPYTAELAFLTVRPAHRRTGIGRALLEAAWEELRHRGVGHVRIDMPEHESLAGGVAFLAACGLKPVQRLTRLGLRLLDPSDAAAFSGMDDEDSDDGDDD